MFKAVQILSLCLVIVSCSSSKQGGSGENLVTPQFGFPPNGRESLFLPKVASKHEWHEGDDPHLKPDRPRTRADAPEVTTTDIGDTFIVYRTPEGVPYSQKQGEEPWAKFVFSLKNKTETRGVSKGDLRAQVFTGSAEVEYFGQDKERIFISVGKDGKTEIYGTVIVDGAKLKIDPKNQRCSARKSESSDDSLGNTFIFECFVDALNISGECFIPLYNHWSKDPDEQFRSRPVKS
jgi:hypothetical protein